MERSARDDSTWTRQSLRTPSAIAQPRQLSLLALPSLQQLLQGVYDGMRERTDGFQHADPQKVAQATSNILANTPKHDIEQTACAVNLVPKAGTHEVDDLRVRGEEVFAANDAESLELLRSAVEAYSTRTWPTCKQVHRTSCGFTRRGFRRGCE